MKRFEIMAGAVLLALVVTVAAETITVPFFGDAYGTAQVTGDSDTKTTTLTVTNATVTGTLTATSISGAVGGAITAASITNTGYLVVDGNQTLGNYTGDVTTAAGNLVQSGPSVTLAGATVVSGVTTITNAVGLLVLGPSRLNNVWKTNTLLTIAGLTNTVIVQGGVITRDDLLLP